MVADRLLALDLDAGPPIDGEGRATHPANVEAAATTPHANSADCSAHGHDPVRCRRCRRPLHAAISVALVTGPVCHRKLLAVSL
jgi:hypothetical protein